MWQQNLSWNWWILTKSNVECMCLGVSKWNQWWFRTAQLGHNWWWNMTVWIWNYYGIDNYKILKPFNPMVSISLKGFNIQYWNGFNIRCFLKRPRIPLSSSIKCEGSAHCFLQFQWHIVPWVLTTSSYS